MCGPIEKCCCCFPATVGVKFIGMFLVLVDISGMIYSTVILHINNQVRLSVSVISVKTTFLLLSVVSRGAGARDAQLHLVHDGGDSRVLRPHHHQHCSRHRSNQEKQARLSHGKMFVKFSFFLLQILFYSLACCSHDNYYWPLYRSSGHHDLLHLSLSSGQLCSPIDHTVDIGSHPVVLVSAN